MTAALDLQTLSDIWVYLSASPLLGLTATLAAYALAVHLAQRAHFHPLANPVAMSVAMLGTALHLTQTPYRTYFDGAQFVHFLLGPATVALAIPLYEQSHRLKRLALPLVGGLLAGSLAGAVSAVLLAHALGASPETLASLAPKSVTTPVAMGISQQLGGLPSLTAVLVVLTGIVGATLGRWLFDRMGLHDPAVRGFALGVAAHGIGTARAFQVSETMGAFAGLAMGLTALVSAVILPPLLGMMMPLLLP